MPNLIQEVQEELNKTPPLKVDIKPVMGAPQPTEPTPIPVQAPQPLQLPEPTPLQPVESKGSPIPEVPTIDSLAYGDTVSRMSAQSAEDIRKTLANTSAPKPNEVQKNLLQSNTPVQIDPKLTSQNNPFSPQTAQERLMFEPPVLSNGLGNPFSDPNALAALRAGVSKEEYLAYKRDLDKSNEGDSPLFNLGLQDKLRSVLPKPLESFEGLTGDQIRARMSRVSGFNTFRRNLNTNFLPFSGSENRNELETLLSALSFPANLVKGVALDITRPFAAGVAGLQTTNLGGGNILPSINIDKVREAYDAMRPTRGGSYTGAAILGEQFPFLAQPNKGEVYNPLAAVYQDSFANRFIAGGLDLLADPLNVDAVTNRLFAPFARASKVEVPRVTVEVPKVVEGTPPRPELPPARTIDVQAKPIITPPNPRQSDRVLITAPPTESRAIIPYVPELSITREAPKTRDIVPVVRDAETLSKYEPVAVEFPTPRQPFTPIPDSRAIVPVPEVNMYNNVTALFNDSKELSVVQRFMRDVVEQKPYEQIPDARSLVVQQNPVLREVAEFARTGDLTPNIAVLQGAPANEIAEVVSDRLALIRENPIVVPKIEVQPLEVPQLAFDITSQLPRRVPREIVESGTLSRTLAVSLDNIEPPKLQVTSNVDRLAQQILDAGDNVEPVILKRVSPVKYEIVGDPTNYYAAQRALEINPNADINLRSVVVSQDSEAVKYYTSLQRAEEEVRKLAPDTALVGVDAPTTSVPSSFKRVENTRTYNVNTDNITSFRSSTYSKEAVEKLARHYVETGENLRPIVLRRTGAETFDVVRGNLEYLAAKRAQELDKSFTGVRAYIVDGVNEKALLQQLDLLDGTVPVPTTKPVVLGESEFATLSDLQDAARTGDTLSEVSQWSPRGDFSTPLKDVLNAVDDLGIDELNTPSLAKLVKGRVGKLADKTVKEVAQSLQKVKLDNNEDVAKSVFNALWRKSTDDQKQLILSTLSTKRLNDLGLERVQTKIVPPTQPTMRHDVSSGLVDVEAYQVFNESQIPIEHLRVAALREQGYDLRTASSMKIHPLIEEIELTGRVSDKSLDELIRTKELTIDTVSERNWSSKMLQRIWEVATPEQKALIMRELDTRTLENLGLERIARSNVIDDHLPPETIFDVPC